VVNARVPAELAHGLDEIEGSPYGALSIVLLRHRSTPHRHHCVTDELLDLTAIASDHSRGELEVPREQLAHVFGITVFRERGEADEVGEENGDKPSLDR